MAENVRVNVTVNGESRESDVEPRLLLVHYLRDTLGLTGTHIGCDTSNCGACTVLLDGESVKSCTVLAAQADGCEVKTIEGMAPGGNGALHPIQEAFWEHHGLQCGYCTPGHDHGRRGPARTQPQPHRGRGAPRARGQPLPLYRLPQHRQGGDGGRGVHGLRKGGERMTATADDHHHKRRADRPPHEAQGGPAPDHGPRQLRGRHGRSPACSTWPSSAPRSRTARSGRSTRAPPRACRACTRCSPVRTSTWARRCRWSGCRQEWR